MKKIVEYFYYRCYDFLCIFKSYDIYFAALHLMCILTGFLLVHLLGYFPIHKNLIEQYKPFGILFYLLPMLVFYFLVFKNSKYDKIISCYQTESKMINIIGKIGTASLIIILISLIFITKPNWK